MSLATPRLSSRAVNARRFLHLPKYRQGFLQRCFERLYVTNGDVVLLIFFVSCAAVFSNLCRTAASRTDFIRLRTGISSPKITATCGAIGHPVRSAARVAFGTHLHGFTAFADVKQSAGTTNTPRSSRQNPRP